MPLQLELLVDLARYSCTRTVRYLLSKTRRPTNRPTDRRPTGSLRRHLLLCTVLLCIAVLHFILYFSGATFYFIFTGATFLIYRQLYWHGCCSDWYHTGTGTSRDPYNCNGGTGYRYCCRLNFDLPVRTYPVQLYISTVLLILSTHPAYKSTPGT